MPESLLPPSASSRAVLAALRALQAKVESLKAENRTLQQQLKTERERAAGELEIERERSALQLRAELAQAREQLAHREEEIRTLRLNESSLREAVQGADLETAALRRQLSEAKEAAAAAERRAAELQQRADEAQGERARLEERVANMHKALSAELLRASEREAELDGEVKRVRAALARAESEVAALAKRSPVDAAKPSSSSSSRRRTAVGLELPFAVGAAGATSHSLPANVQDVLARKPLYLDSEMRSRVRVASDDGAVLERKAAQQQRARSAPRKRIIVESESVATGLDAAGGEAGGAAPASLDEVTQQLEGELAALHERYSALRGEAEASEEARERLEELIRDMERKSEQLRALRAHRRRVRGDAASLPSFRSPAARRTYERKVRSMRLLGEFRRLFDEAK